MALILSASGAGAAPHKASPAPSEALIGGASDEDGLSMDLPARQTGQEVSSPRFKRPLGWQPDGEVLAADGFKAVAGQGDLILARMKGKISTAVGERLIVYRASSAKDSDEEKKSRYLQEVGLVEVTRGGRGARVQALILKTGGAVQAGDWLKRAKQ